MVEERSNSRVLRAPRRWWKRTAHLAVLASLVLALLPALACESAAQTRDDSFTVGDSPSLVVRSRNGFVEVHSAAGNTVRVVATLHDADRVDYTVSQDGDIVTVDVDTASRGWYFWRSPGVDLEITAPPGTVLDIDTSNGRIEADGVQAGGRLHTSNGEITINDMAGDLNIETSNGGIEVSGFQGALTADTSNARVSVEGIAGSADVETSNGSISFEGQFVPESTNRLETSNGSVDVTLSGTPSVRLDATTSNGEIDVGLPIETSIDEDTHVVGTIGEGAADLTIRTSNGSVTVE